MLVTNSSMLHMTVQIALQRRLREANQRINVLEAVLQNKRDQYESDLCLEYQKVSSLQTQLGECMLHDSSGQAEHVTQKQLAERALV